MSVCRPSGHYVSGRVGFFIGFIHVFGNQLSIKRREFCFMKELELKYGCNPNQKPARIYMKEGELPIRI